MVGAGVDSVVEALVLSSPLQAHRNAKPTPMRKNLVQEVRGRVMRVTGALSSCVGPTVYTPQQLLKPSKCKESSRWPPPFVRRMTAWRGPAICARAPKAAETKAALVVGAVPR